MPQTKIPATPPREPSEIDHEQHQARANAYYTSARMGLARQIGGPEVQAKVRAMLQAAVKVGAEQ